LKLKGRAALVTAPAQAPARAIAQQLAREGVRLVITGRRKDGGLRRYQLTSHHGRSAPMAGPRRSEQ